MNIHLKRAAIPAAIGACLGGLVPVSSRAQGVSQIEEVVITARRREESLQEVPLSVVAFGSEDLEVRGLEQLEDLSARVPNISLLGGGATGDAEGSFVMRGIPGVGTYIDGVWQATADGLLRSEFVELERVEVLRGPQGTLFGKNTTGGAINIVTARPAEEFGAKVKATTGSYSRRDLTIGIDVPFSETFRARFSGASLTKDGFIHSTTIDRSFGDVDNQVLRADFVWEPADTFDLRFIYETNDRNENGVARIQHGFIEDGTKEPVNQWISRSQYFTYAGVDLRNVAAASGFPGGRLGENETRSDTETDGTIVDLASATIDINWDLTDKLGLRSITSHRTNLNRIYTDFDAVEVTLIEDDRNRNQRQTTQEFQFTGDGDRFSWVGGAYFWDETNDQRQFRQTFTEFRKGQLNFVPVLVQEDIVVAASGLPFSTYGASSFGGPPNSDEFFGQATDGWALFGEVDINLTDQLTLTVGYRTQEEDFSTYTKTPVDSVAAPGGYFFGNNAFSCSNATNICTPNAAFDFGNFAVAQRYPADLMFRGSIGRVNTATLGPGQVPTLLGLQSAEIPTAFDSDTGRLSLAYQLNDDLMVYGTYSEGFGAGGVSQSQVAIGGVPTIVVQPFLPEEVENFELGFRSDLLDGRLRLNLTYFSGEWTGIQVSETVENLDCILAGGTAATCPNLPSLLTFNAGAADVSGAEIEIVARFTDSFLLDANFGFLDTEYTDTGVSQDIQPGDTFQQAPDLTYSIGAQWNGALSSGGETVFRIDYAYTDSYVRARERQRQTGQDEFGLVNARFSYAPPAANWRLAIFGTNLTDEFYLNSGFLSTGTTQDLATIGRPREAGVSLEFFFD